MALAAPKRNPNLDSSTPTRHRMGLAFTEYLETRPEHTVPHSGGVAATVVVTMTIETLMGGLQAAGLCDGTRISAGEARRLACGAGIIPVVLGGPSEPLDVGRQRRFHTKAMRIAMGIRDTGCTVVGCDRPPAMCQAHHDRPGAEAATPTSRPADSCANATTPSPTTPATRWTVGRTGRSPSPDGRDIPWLLQMTSLAHCRVRPERGARSNPARIAFTWGAAGARKHCDCAPRVRTPA